MKSSECRMRQNYGIPMFCFIGTGFFLHRHAALFLTFRRSGSVPAVRKEKRMYYDQHVCGARIQELRKSKGYTQEALAEAIDIDAKRISKIERGVISASYNDMILFSEFFGVTLDYLIIGKRQDVDALKKRVQDAITQLQEALM